MKANKITLSVFMILLMIGLTVPPSVTGEDFIVDITSAQNTALEPGTVNFGVVVAGTTDTIEPTFTLNNTGNLAATVTAAFTTNVGSTYGFTNSTYDIGGSNFSLQSNVSGTYTQLLSTASGQTMTDDVPANTAEAWNARLVIPAGQTALLYSGTIQVTFS